MNVVVLKSIIKVQPGLSKSPDILFPDERSGLDPRVEEGVNPVYSLSTFPRLEFSEGSLRRDIPY